MQQQMNITCETNVAKCSECSAVSGRMKRQNKIYHLLTQQKFVTQSKRSQYRHMPVYSDFGDESRSIASILGKTVSDVEIKAAMLCDDTKVHVGVGVEPG
jgi:hypothetical protein